MKTLVGTLAILIPAAFAHAQNVPADLKVRCSLADGSMATFEGNFVLIDGKTLNVYKITTVEGPTTGSELVGSAPAKGCGIIGARMLQEEKN